MIFDGRNSDRLEGAEADMKSDFRGLNAAIAQARENFGSEVKSGRWGGDGSTLTGIDGLVAISVGRSILAGDIGRKRDMADGFNGGEEIIGGSETDVAFTEFAAGDDLGLQLTAGFFPEEKTFSYGDFAAGSNETLPFVGIMAKLAGEQDFDAAVEKLAGSRVMRAERLGMEAGAAGVESRGKDSGVVEDDEIVGTQKIGKITKLAVGQCFVSRPNLQQTRGATVGEGLLGDEFFGEIVVEIGDQHAFRL